MESPIKPQLRNPIRILEVNESFQKPSTAKPLDYLRTSSIKI